MMKKRHTSQFLSTNKESMIVYMLRHAHKQACNQDFVKGGDLEVKFFV